MNNFRKYCVFYNYFCSWASAEEGQEYAPFFSLGGAFLTVWKVFLRAIFFLWGAFLGWRFILGLPTVQIKKKYAGALAFATRVVLNKFLG